MVALLVDLLVHVDQLEAVNSMSVPITLQSISLVRYT